MRDSGMVNNMLTKEDVKKDTEVDLKKRKAFILAVEEKIGAMPEAVFGDEACPLKHSFGDGLYIREITMPKGMLLTSKIHKHTHPYFVLKGDVSVLTDEGVVRIKAPFSGMTKPGTKRVLYMHEETVWTTVHLNTNNTTDLKEIEEEVIAKSFEDIFPTYEEVLKLTEV